MKVDGTAGSITVIRRRTAILSLAAKYPRVIKCTALGENGRAPLRQIVLGFDIFSIGDLLARKTLCYICI